MDYLDKWEKMKAQVEKLKSEPKLIHNFNNPYGFRININHPDILPKYEEWKKRNQIGRYDMTDELRDKFETEFMKSKYYKKLVENERKKYGAAYDYIYEPLVR